MPTPTERIREIVRHFPENSFKRLLENPANVHDLLRLAGAKILDRIDFAAMKPTAATYVQSDYRHVAADLVLTAPLLPGAGQRRRRRIVVYILIEHQSEPERLMPLRALSYVVEAYQSQVRDWPTGRAERAESLLQPVLPVVFYTGDRTWERVGTLLDLIDGAELFEAVTPLMSPLFVNVRALAPGVLESKGGLFGQVLRLWRKRRAKLSDFRGLLHEVVRRLDQMPEAEQGRWLELLSYVHALVYHVREPSEQPKLQEMIAATVQTGRHQKEEEVMRRTIADELKEQGELRALRRTLLRLLRARFGELPSDVVTTVETSDEPGQLERWLDGVVAAKTLKELRINQGS